MQPLCRGHLRADWADRMLQTDFLRLDAMPIRLEQMLFLLMKRAGWGQVVMISRSVEISIPGREEEMVCAYLLVTFFCFFL